MENGKGEGEEKEGRDEVLRECAAPFLLLRNAINFLSGCPRQRQVAAAGKIMLLKNRHDGLRDRTALMPTLTAMVESFTIESRLS